MLGQISKCVQMLLFFLRESVSGWVRTALLQEVKKKDCGGLGGGGLEDVIYQFANRLESVNGGHKRTFRLSCANAPPSCDVISFPTRFLLSAPLLLLPLHRGGNRERKPIPTVTENCPLFPHKIRKAVRGFLPLLLLLFYLSDFLGFMAKH